MDVKEKIDVKKDDADHDGLLRDRDGSGRSHFLVSSSGKQCAFGVNAAGLPAFSLLDDGFDGERARAARAFTYRNAPIQAEFSGGIKVEVIQPA